MRTMRAADVNHQFFYVLKQVSMGEEFLIISRRKPVATISPVRKTAHTSLRRVVCLTAYVARKSSESAPGHAMNSM
jgi:antitoxin (DNA-binding transcriptional repressor) of toxin-antitoxin stability system